MYTVTTLSFKNLFQFVPFKELLYLVPISSCSLHSLFLSTLPFFPSPLGLLTSAPLQVLISLSRMLFSLVQFSRSVLTHGLQHARPSCPSPTPEVCPNSCPSSRWCHPTISSSVAPSPPAPNPSQDQGLFQWVNSSHQVAKVLEFQLRHQSFQWTPRDDL